MARRTAQWAVIGAGVVALIWMVVTSLDRNSYFYYLRQDRSRWEYPTSSVAFIGVAMALETILAYFVLARERPWRMWARALAGLGILVPWGWWISEFIVHAPGYWIVHILWVWLLIALLALSALLSGVADTYARIGRWRGRA